MLQVLLAFELCFVWTFHSISVSIPIVLGVGTQELIHWLLGALPHGKMLTVLPFLPHAQREKNKVDTEFFGCSSCLVFDLIGLAIVGVCINKQRLQVNVITFGPVGAATSHRRM